MVTINRKVILLRPLEDVPTAADFGLAEAPVPEPGPGQFLVRHIYLSLDPYQRPAMAGRHLTARTPLPPGGTPGGETVGQVVSSRHPDFAPGDFVRHMGGWQEYALADGTGVERLDPSAAPLSTCLGVLGMPGLTAWASVYPLGQVQAGETVLVSAAAGPVGSMVGQLAMHQGARAIGIAGGAEKCRLVTGEYGFAACLDHRDPDFAQALRQATGDGVDVYHDNVGGPMLASAVGVLKPYGRVVMCGLMSQYNATTRPGVDLGPLIMKRAVLKGLVVFDYEPRRAEFLALAAPLVRSGRIRYREDRVQGLEHAGALFARLMAGGNVGKALVVVSAEP